MCLSPCPWVSGPFSLPLFCSCSKRKGGILKCITLFVVVFFFLSCKPLYKHLLFDAIKGFNLGFWACMLKILEKDNIFERSFNLSPSYQIYVNVIICATISLNNGNIYLKSFSISKKYEIHCETTRGRIPVVVYHTPSPPHGNVEVMEKSAWERFKFWISWLKEGTKLLEDKCFDSKISKMFPI